MPLLERGQGTVPAARARAEGTRYTADALATAVVQRIQAAHAEASKRVEVLERFRKETAVLNDGMRSEAEAGYRESKLSVLELVDAYNTLRDARLRLVDLTEAAHVARASLGRAIGGEALTP
jgi:outer membrane protein TolC